MNKGYQKFKKICISLVLFALLAALMVPYHIYAASNEAESVTKIPVTDSTGDFFIPLEHSSKKEEAEEWRVFSEKAAETLTPNIDTVLSKVREYILKKDTKPEYSSIWNVIGLKRSGLNVPKSYTDLFYSNVIAYCEREDWQITRAKYSDYSKLILALTAIGVDARNVMGHNLFSYLSDYANVSSQGNNGPIWALIALNCNPAYTIPINPSASQQTTEELLIQKILKMQCADGGWTLKGTKGDSDMTGMAIQALSSYYGKREDVTKAIDKGLFWISTNELKSGGFSTMGTETAESTAQIITGLCGIGIDCGKDSRFIKNGKWPMTGLFQYYMPEGGFMHIISQTGNAINGMATEQSFYATVAYRRLLAGNTFLYDMSDVKITPGKKPVVSPTIRTYDADGIADKNTENNVSKKVKVIKISLKYSKIYVEKGKSKTLKATVSPSNASNKSVSWSSSNKSVVTVNAKGKITGKKAGNATITVKAKDGSGKKAACKVVVTVPETINVKKTTALNGQTKQGVPQTDSGEQNSFAGDSGNDSSNVPSASGTTKTLPQAASSSKSTSGTTSKKATKKKKTAKETTAEGWSFSGDDYVPDMYSAQGEDESVENSTEENGENIEAKTKSRVPSRMLYIAGGAGGFALVEVCGVIVYKKRRNITNILKKISSRKNGK